MRNQGRKNGPGRLMRRKKRKRRSPEEKSTSKRSTIRALAVWKKRVGWKADSFESVYFFSLSAFFFPSLCFFKAKESTTKQSNDGLERWSLVCANTPTLRKKLVNRVKHVVSKTVFGRTQALFGFLEERARALFGLMAAWNPLQLPL